MKYKKIMIICGGTGGHIFPGLEIAKFLKKKGWIINWLGTSNRIESILVPKNGFKIHLLNIPNNLYKKNILKKIYCLIKFFFACAKSFYYIKLLKPDIVLGMGGYVSGIGCLAAWIKGIPIVIHEQNKVVGLANKLISKIAKKKLQAFSGVINNAETVGNPIRKNILSLLPPEKRLNNRTGPIKILVLGGSQGSWILNKIVPEFACILGKKINIWHQTGKLEKKKVIAYYKRNNFYFYKVNSFIHDIHKAYNWSDLVICRSGALTVSEISAVGIPAIFVPFEHKDHQQYWNAMILKEVHAAEIICQNKFTVKKLLKTLKKLDRSKLLYMAKQARSISIRDSTQKIFYFLNQ